MPGYTASHSVHARKQQIYVQNSMEKTALNGEIPVNKYQNHIYHNYVIIGGHYLYSTKELKLRVRL